ncbi:hypothetical protein [Sporosarcina sp. HYO08]|uniref:hypothetical protein n=1 Tax=Sporosarcina sp. HYO08 TaxID=1759557 RepID=UPI0007928E8F|nr:hypothetical protein [Sporosarcina sp. HYO08]KXH87437.1 hypothetical protein AU377_02375 [Sporosarcina sp. HYO08]
MELTIIILLIIGVISLVASFFTGRQSNHEIEQISISLHNETNHLHKRLKVIEEELMIGVGTMPTESKMQNKNIHEIIVNQIYSLHSQGYAVHDIAARSSLTEQDVIAVLQKRGANR